MRIRRPNPLTLVAALLLAGGLWGTLRSDDPADASSAAEPCDPATDPLCVPEGSVVGATGPTLSADSVCRNDTGYLCAGLETETRVQLRRWKNHNGTIVVHIPRPSYEADGHARRLQAAAAAGVRAWNGQPFPISVDERGTREAHFSVRWRQRLGGTVLGSARTNWSASEGLSVDRLELATRSPTGGGMLSPEAVRLVAAHEMGHALGILHHSDSPRDVMYPQNTANALTARDYRTIGALYSLPDGAYIAR